MCSARRTVSSLHASERDFTSHSPIVDTRRFLKQPLVGIDHLQSFRISDEDRHFGREPTRDDEDGAVVTEVEIGFGAPEGESLEVEVEGLGEECGGEEGEGGEECCETW